MDNVKYWAGIAVLALVCLWQEAKGEDPDCPDCWKCESMRVLFLCLGAFIVTELLLWLIGV